MPVTGAEFQQRTEDEILAFLEAELRSEYGENIDLTESSVFLSFASALATEESEQVEPVLQEVFESAYIEDASGEQLDKLLDIIGISRRPAVNATGTITFTSSSLASQDYPISRGTIVQTTGQGSVSFETTEAVDLEFMDNFEGGALRTAYGGDRADFSVVSGSSSADPSPAEGSNELRGEAVSGSLVYDTGEHTYVGSRFTFHTYLSNDTASAAASGCLFGVQSGTDYYRINVDSSDSVALESVTGGSATELDSTSPTVPTEEWLEVEVHWLPANDGTIEVIVRDSSDTEITSFSVTNESTFVEGGFGYESLDGNEIKYWDHTAMDEVMANIRAVEAGPSGNVGADTITDMPSIPAGVDTVTNEYPTGDDDHLLTDLTTFALGRVEEDDDTFRDRALVSEGERGDATAPAIISALSGLPGAESVRVIQNKDDSTDADGRPPTSFEAVYYGVDDDQDVAETIFGSKGFTAHDVGGYAGTSKSTTVRADNGQEFTITWSEPTEVAVDMTLDVVVNDEYIGSDALRDRIVEYIGGTLTDGTATLGTDVEEDVYVDQIEDIVTGPEDTGVIGISSYSFTPSATTDTNGLEVVSIGGTEVAATNATDGSITINVTTV